MLHCILQPLEMIEIVKESKNFIHQHVLFVKG